MKQLQEPINNQISIHLSVNPFRFHQRRIFL